MRTCLVASAFWIHEVGFSGGYSVFSLVSVDPEMRARIFGGGWEAIAGWFSARWYDGIGVRFPLLPFAWEIGDCIYLCFLEFPRCGKERMNEAWIDNPL